MATQVNPLGQQVKPKRSNKAPAVKAAVIAARATGSAKRKIARDLKLSRPTVEVILKESEIDLQLSTGRSLTAGLIPRAIGVIEHRLSQNSENAAIKVLEATIWPLNKQAGKQNDPHLTLAIQNLMGNVTVQASPNQADEQAKPIEAQVLSTSTESDSTSTSPCNNSPQKS